MAFNLFGGKRRITKGFFANSLGNKQEESIHFKSMWKMES